MLNRLKSVLRIVLWIGTLLVVIYLLFLIPRYEKYRKSNVSFDIDLPPLTAYAWPHAYTAGDSIRLFVHAEHSYLGTIYRVGDGGFIPVDSLVGHAVTQDEAYALKSGHNWRITHSISTTNWKPGFYIVALTLDGNSAQKFSVPVLVRSKEGNRILVVAPTNTWQAYNEYGGKSNYGDEVTPKDLSTIFSFLERVSPGLVPYTYLPTKRPFDHPFSTAPLDDSLALQNGKITSDLYLIQYLEELGVDYGIISDTDLEKLVTPGKTELVIFNNHSEYWSYGGMGSVKNLLAVGVDIAFLSGNNMYREIEALADGALIVLEQQLPRVAAEPILGTFYSESGYQTLGSFRVIKENHWIFDGTGLAVGDTFGGGIISGVETDKLGPYSEGFTLLAIGDNTSGPAHMVIKEMPAGNFIFNSSSLSSVRAIRTDTAWRRMIANILESSSSKGKE
jgi:hypothetical protein